MVLPHGGARMTRIFCDAAERQPDGTLILTGEHFHHVMKVLKLHPGEEIGVHFTGETAEYRYGIEEIGTDTALCRLRFVKEDDVELPCKVTLLQGLPKGDKMDTVVQKSVELGVWEIIPVSCARSIVRLDWKRGEKKRERWQKIAESAAEQSHRAKIPGIVPPMEFSQAVAAVEDRSVKLIAYELAGQQGATMEQTREIFRRIDPRSRIALLIGPEGGFTEEEVREAVSRGFTPVTLGRRILRTETAAMTVLSWLVLLLDR